MKKVIRRIASFFLIFCIVFSFSSCSLITFDTDSLLTPPRASGELYYIQKALESSVKEKFTLKYPTDGDWRSAVIQHDIDNDGIDEAIVFYSTVTDKIVSMHMNYIIKKDKEYVSVSDIKCVATGVESVSFNDMDNDGVSEILVGWSVYGTLDKMLGVYSLEKELLVQRVMENYTHYVCSDFTGDGKKDIFINHLNTSETLANAKLLTLTKDGVSERGSCILDGSVTSHSAPIVGKLPNGNTAIYIDAVKGNGMITEILEILPGNKTNIMQNVLTALGADKSISTYRSSAVSIRDNNGDGVYEIPMPQIITDGVSAAEQNVYKTRWYIYDGGELILQLSALMNYADGYYIAVPLKWENSIIVISDTANRIRTITAVDAVTGNSSEVIVKVQAVPLNSAPSFEGYDATTSFEVGRNDSFYYVAQIGNYKGGQAVTPGEFRQLFNLF